MRLRSQSVCYIHRKQRFYFTFALRYLHCEDCPVTTGAQHDISAAELKAHCLNTTPNLRNAFMLRFLLYAIFTVWLAKNACVPCFRCCVCFSHQTNLVPTNSGEPSTTGRKTQVVPGGVLVLVASLPTVNESFRNVREPSRVRRQTACFPFAST